MKKLLFLLLLIPHLVMGNTFFLSGNRLLEAINTNKDAAILFIYGVNDTFSLVQFGYKLEPKYCLPKALDDGNQLLLVVKKYLENNPSQLHESATILVSLALREPFPCP
tara:strand:+ start:178 stop:504 length:327 start_codon:yes stop_codon:yes gene_type:complete